MPGDSGPDLTRRFVLAASAGLMITPWTWAESAIPLAKGWKLEETGDSAQERVSGKADAIASRTGHGVWAGTGKNRALRLDGYSVWVDHDAGELPLRSGALTLSAWLALESYPVEEAAIVHLGGRPDAEVSLSIDRLGFLKCTMKRGMSSVVCKSPGSIAKARWVHFACSVGDSGITLYANGSPCGHEPASAGKIQFASDARVTLGKSPHCPVIAGVFPAGVLNGLLRDVRVFDACLTQQAIASVMQESRPDRAPDLQINGAWCADDPQRPVYHALPPRAWTNEPHGLVYWRGQYHLFYQKNPNGPYWGHIHWGHLTSPDLRQWTEMPVALTPEPGPDQEGCWSGSALVYEDKLALIYTGGNGSRSAICLAMSDDGIHFTKHPGNPIIAEPPQLLGFSEFRDPHVWREGDVYYLIIGSALKDVGGAALLYRSKDLVNWEYRKPLLVGDRGSSGTFWEMPIFVKLGDKHALIVCEVPGRASYWVGTWKNENFVPLSMTPQRLELLNHLLSPTPCLGTDGSLTTMAIVPDQRSPKDCWSAGWAHLYSLPRVITADDRGRLHQRPHEAVAGWFEPVQTAVGIKLADGAMQAMEGSGTALHIRVAFQRMTSRRVALRVRASGDGREYTDIAYEWENGKLIVDRSRSSIDHPMRMEIEEATYVPDTRDRLEMEVFLDRSVLEVFLDGRAAFATRMYPTLDASTGVALGSSGGGAEVETLSIARMRSQA